MPVSLTQKMNPGADKTPGLEALLGNNTELNLDNAYLHQSFGRRNLR